MSAVLQYGMDFLITGVGHVAPPYPGGREGSRGWKPHLQSPSLDLLARPSSVVQKNGAIDFEYVIPGILLSHHRGLVEWASQGEPRQSNP